MLNLDLKLQRYDIVNGVVEVDGVNDEAAMDVADDKAKEGIFFFLVYVN